MIGLIKKDLLLIKGNLKTILFVVFGLLLMAFNGMSQMSFILPLICVMLFMSTFSYDDYNKWNAFVITLPHGRENAVKSKYISTIILTIVSSLITFLVSLLIGRITHQLDLEEIFGTIIGGISATLLLITIMYPFIYKFGIEKGRIFLFLGAFIITAFFGLLFMQLEKLGIRLDSFVNFFNQYWFLILPIVLIGGLGISYQTSKHFYGKSEY